MSETITRVEGYVDKTEFPPGGRRQINVYETPIPDDKCCLLLIGDKDIPKVFTQDDMDLAEKKLRLTQWLVRNLEEVVLSFRSKHFRGEGIGEVAFKFNEVAEFDVLYEPETTIELVIVRYNTLKRKFLSISGFGTGVDFTL